MLKRPRYAVPLCAAAVVSLLAASSAAVAGFERFPLSGKGVQKGAVIMGDKSTPKRQPTHSHGALSVVGGGPGRLRGPEMRESGAGRLEGGEKPGAKGTPKRQPTLSVTPR